mgnify:CR=1 FL=1
MSFDVFLQRFVDGEATDCDARALLAVLDPYVERDVRTGELTRAVFEDGDAEVYGTDGSLRWNFEHLNDLEVCLGADNEFQGYTRVMAGPTFPNFSRFQPGAGTSMGFDDLKAIEAAQFIESVLTGKQLAPSAADGWAAAEVDQATVASARDGQWHDVAPVTGPTTYDA